MTFTATHPFVDDTNDFTPINDMQVVVPNDGADLPQGQCRAIIFQGTGTVALVTALGNTITLTISANWFGVTYIRAKRILATGTTVAAGNIIACY
jgi:hypothetical protein